MSVLLALPLAILAIVAAVVLLASCALQGDAERAFALAEDVWLA
jgi:hypothetical protein